MEALSLEARELSLQVTLRLTSFTNDVEGLTVVHFLCMYSRISKTASRSATKFCLPTLNRSISIVKLFSSSRVLLGRRDFLPTECVYTTSRAKFSGVTNWVSTKFVPDLRRYTRSVSLCTGNVDNNRYFRLYPGLCLLCTRVE